MRRLLGNIIFFISRIHWVKKFPYFSVSLQTFDLDMDEIMLSLPLLRKGDIGLHTTKGYLSNLLIPGFFKHSWIVVKEGVTPQIVEALSEGVTYRNAAYPMLSDYVLILRPTGVSEEDKELAARRAISLIGKPYDIFFDFDIKEVERCSDYPARDKLLDDIKEAECLKRIFKIDRYSCTEVCAFSWWKDKERLGIVKKKYFFKEIIAPDVFLGKSWDVIWVSSSLSKKDPVDKVTSYRALEVR